MRTEEEVTADMRRSCSGARERQRRDGPNAIDADFVHVIERALRERGWKPRRAARIQARTKP